MKKFALAFITLCLVVGIGTMGCEKGKKGCIDVYATNYDPLANLDDQPSCLYLSDLIVGNYTTKDTTVKRTAGGQSVGATAYAQYPFTITRTDNNNVMLVSFGQCTAPASVPAEVVNGQIIIAYWDCKQANNSVILYVSDGNKKISYSYTYPSTAGGGGGGGGGLVTATTSGVATKL